MDFFLHHSLFLLCGFVGFKALASNTWRTKASYKVWIFASSPFVFREMSVSLEGLVLVYFLSGFELLIGLLSLLLGSLLLLGFVLVCFFLKMGQTCSFVEHTSTFPFL